jgi:hypothetical protein
MKKIILLSLITCAVIATAVIFSYKSLHKKTSLTNVAHFVLPERLGLHNFQNPSTPINGNSLLNTSLNSTTDIATETFWVKAIFSGIFLIAALFVVLSQKYDPETKKWAFSILTLIAGVWIGTIS